jgi:hypothetical protein
MSSQNPVALPVAGVTSSLLAVVSFIYLGLIVLSLHSAWSTLSLFIFTFALLGWLFITRRVWLSKFSARLGIGLLTVTAAVGFLEGDHIGYLEGFQRYRIVIELLIGITFLQKVVSRLGLSGALKASIATVGPKLRALTICLFSMLLAFPLSLATVPLITSVISSCVKPPIAAARISMRAVSLTMLLIPTTLASAAVSASLPGLDASMVAIAGLPLFFIGTCAICFHRVEMSETLMQTPSRRKLVVFGIAFWALFGIFSKIGLMSSEAIAATGVCVYLGEMIIGRRQATTCAKEMHEAVSGTSAEVILLLACGVLSTYLASKGESPHLKLVMAQLWGGPFMATAWVAFILPAISAFGVHPLILFAVVFPIVDSSVFGGPHLQYLAWVMMFIASQLLSPASISAILAASSLKVTPTETSYKLHAKYVGMMCTIAYFYLLLARYTSLT